MQASARLIVTGDDFGVSSRVNEEIHCAYEAGLLQQASLVVTGDALDEAVRIIRRCPGLTVGLHLTLCAGRGARASRLTNANGHLPGGPVFAGLLYTLDPRLERGLGAEIDAQFATFRQLGFGVSHWDGHCHLHLHPKVFAYAAANAGSDFGYVRLIRSPQPRSFLECVFNQLSRSALRRLQTGPSVVWADAVYGLRYTGRMNTSNFLTCVCAVQPGQLVEIYYHPGADAGEITPSVVLEVIRRRGIILCSSRSCARP